MYHTADALAENKCEIHKLNAVQPRWQAGAVRMAELECAMAFKCCFVISLSDAELRMQSAS